MSSSTPDNCELPSSFFKVIRPGRMLQVSMPKAFRPYLQDIKNRNAILRRENKKWQVKIVGDWMFGEGWENYVRDNGVEDRNFIVFSHLGNLVFDTVVYDESLCEKKYPNNQDTIAGKKISKGKDTRSTGTSGLSEASRIHYFKSILTASRLKDSEMNIPLKVAGSNGLVDKDCEMIVIDEKQKLWRMRLSNPYDHVRIRGIRPMMLDNGLKEGDEFILEIVDNGDIPVMKFHRVDNN